MMGNIPDKYKFLKRKKFRNLTTGQIIEICNNIWYRKDEFNPTQTELLLIKRIIDKSKITSIEELSKFAKISEKYNML